MKKIAVVLILGVAFCYLMTSSAQADPLEASQAKNYMNNSVKAAAIPIWKITQDKATGNPPDSVQWVDACNERFAVYDTNGDNTTDQSTWVDDVVLDKETGLVWQRSPYDETQDFYSWSAAVHFPRGVSFGGRRGWRLPAVEELESLMAPTADWLPQCHPFINVGTGGYWTSTSCTIDSNPLAYVVFFSNGAVAQLALTPGFGLWFVRGGRGPDYLPNLTTGGN